MFSMSSELSQRMYESFTPSGPSRGLAGNQKGPILDVGPH